LPSNRSYLYKRALDILIEEWAAEKCIQQPQLCEGLYPEVEVRLLSRIAAPAFENGILFFPGEDLCFQIGAFLRQDLNAPKGIDARQVLEAIEVQQGLLVERAHDLYSFSHLTIQEYLSARYVHDEGEVSALVDKHLFDSRWREVFLLFAGMVQADSLLLEMVKILELSLCADHSLHELFIWAENVCRSHSTPAQRAARRACAILVALQAKLWSDDPSGTLNYVYSKSNSTDSAEIDALFVLARGVAETLDPEFRLDVAVLAPLDFYAGIRQDIQDNAAWSPARIVERERELIQDVHDLDIFDGIVAERLLAVMDSLDVPPAEDASDDVKIMFLLEMRRSLLSGLGLSQRWQTESILTDNYRRVLYVTLLIVECARSALSVSGSAWEGITSRLLSARQMQK
jgi:hypothetical protein